MKGNQKISNVIKGRAEHNTSLDAIHKLEKRLRRSKRMITKTKLLAEFRVKADHRNKYVPSYSLSSDHTRNRNSILFKINARKALDIGARLDIKFRGGRGYNLRKCVEMEENELAGMINALDN